MHLPGPARLYRIELTPLSLAVSSCSSQKHKRRSAAWKDYNAKSRSDIYEEFMRNHVISENITETELIALGDVLMEEKTFHSEDEPEEGLDSGASTPSSDAPQSKAGRCSVRLLWRSDLAKKLLQYIDKDTKHAQEVGYTSGQPLPSALCDWLLKKEFTHAVMRDVLQQWLDDNPIIRKVSCAGTRRVRLLVELV